MGLTCETQNDGKVGCGPDDSEFARGPTPSQTVEGEAVSFQTIGEDVFIDPGDPLPTAFSLPKGNSAARKARVLM